MSDDLEIAVVRAESHDEARTRMETARERLAATLDPDATVRLRDVPVPDAVAAEPTVDPETRLEELRDRVLELVDDGGVEDLSDDERTRLDGLREQFHFYEQLAETATQPVRYPALRASDATGAAPEAVAAAVLEPLEPLSPKTVVVDETPVEPVTETALADAVAAATDGSTTA
ncbi:hypothetical protein [Halobaculum sp. MBLA0143]|uniref:hypothetical protein n=1 Tax=Halobaculum sp. MBLA0143 TaxID=3079933 RepID=UPI003523FB69